MNSLQEAKGGQDAEKVSLHLPKDLPEELPEKKELWQVLDSTKLQTFASCPRHYFLEYVLGWRPDRQSNHLVFGQAWHAALEWLYSLDNPKGFSLEAVPDAFDRFLAVYRSVYDESTDSWFGGKTPENALLALCQYVDTYKEDAYRWQVMATEVTDWLWVEPNWGLVVKLDLVARRNSTNEVLLIDHKTGSSSAYNWGQQWHLSLQIGAYIAACNCYYGQTETECIVNGAFFQKTKQSFQREIIKKNDAQMENWNTSVLALKEAIEREWRLIQFDHKGEATLKSFYQNPVSCSKYGGCPFFDLCQCLPNPLDYTANPPTGYKVEWWNPLSEE